MQNYTTDGLSRPPQKYNDDDTDGAAADNATTPFRGVSEENSSNQSEDFSGYHEAHDGTEGEMKGVPSEDNMKEDDATEKETDGSNVMDKNKRDKITGTPINEGGGEKRGVRE